MSAPPPSVDDIVNADGPNRRTLILKSLLDSSEDESRAKDAAVLMVEAMKLCPDLQDTVVDGLWLVGSMKKSMEPYTDMVRVLVQGHASINFWTSLQRHLDPTILEEVGLLGEKKDGLLKKLRMLNTQVHYRQQKYNLLQEESEGYAKLLHLLTNTQMYASVEALEEQLQALIGTFELDPNRVLDLFVDVLEVEVMNKMSSKPASSSSASRCRKPALTPHIEALVTLMKHFPRSKLPPLIGFKLNSFSASSSSSPTSQSSSPSAVSDGLFQTIAVLAVQQVLDVAHMADYFEPVPIAETYRRFMDSEQKRIKAMGRIRLSVDSTSGPNPEDLKQAKAAQRLQQDIQAIESSVLLKLVGLFLQWREWDLVCQLAPSSGSLRQICTLLPNTIGVELCDMVQERIEPIYRARVKTPHLLQNIQNKDTSNKKEDNTPDAMDVVVEPPSSLDEVVRMIAEPLLCTLEAACIRDRPILYCQLCRLFKSFAEEELKDGDDIPWSNLTFTFIKSVLVQSLSLFSSNPALSTELWKLLECLPYTARYKLYSEWRGSGLERAAFSAPQKQRKPLPFIQAEVEAGKNTRYILKRLSNENVREMSRQIAKVTHAHPLVVFTTILNQIESYDNIIPVMVEAVRLVAPLGLDVLGYCILSRLRGDGAASTAGVDRNRLKEDGVNVSQWLQSLESFAGEFYKECPHVEFRGILRYLIHRLKDGHVEELGVLGKLLKISGGWGFEDYSPSASLSQAQLEGRGGSTLLKRETMTFGVVDNVNVEASQQIRSVLQTDGMGVSILLLLAHVRSRVVFETARGRPKLAKLLGNLSDSCQVVISVLLAFLTSSSFFTENEHEGSQGVKVLTAEGRTGQVDNVAMLQFAETMPSLQELYAKHGIDIASTWMICRPLVRAAAARYADALEGGKNSEVPSKRQADAGPWDSFLLTDELRKVYKATLPENTWSRISPDLFEFFYSNSIYDIFFPEARYNTEIARLDNEVERLSSARRSGPIAPHATAVPVHTPELARLRLARSVLASDLTKQKKRVRTMQKVIESKKDVLFPSKESLSSATNAFLTHCIYPRSLQGPDDAFYCARLVSLLHRIETPGFSTVHYIDQLVPIVSGALCCVTEGEAANLSILLHETLKMASNWRYNEDEFSKQFSGKPGSFVEARPLRNNKEKQPKIEQKAEKVCQASTKGSISYKEYKLFYKKWHTLLGSTALRCLNSPDYMHTRACLVVLTRIVGVFPTHPNIGNALLKALAPMQDENYLPDIRASAQAYGVLLAKTRDEGGWKEEDATAKRARKKKEETEAAERKKKAAVQLEEMKRESEMITADIGESRTRGHVERGRPPVRNAGSFEGRALPKTPARYEPDDSPPMLSPRRFNVDGETDDRLRHHSRDLDIPARRNEPNPRDDDQAEPNGRGRKFEASRNHMRSVDRHAAPNIRNRDTAPLNESQKGHQKDMRSLAGRFERGPEQRLSLNRSGKRNRSPSPGGHVGDARMFEPLGTGRDERTMKRPRPDHDFGAQAGGGNTGAATARRPRSRPPSPLARPPSPRSNPPPRSSGGGRRNRR